MLIRECTWEIWKYGYVYTKVILNDPLSVIAVDNAVNEKNVWLVTAARNEENYSDGKMSEQRRHAPKAAQLYVGSNF